MAAPDYKFIVYRTTDGAALDELPLTNVTYSYGLNGTGSLSAQINLDAASATSGNIQTLTREIGVWRNGAPVFQGPITRFLPQLNSDGTLTAQIECAPLWWWFSRRSQELSLSYTSQDIAAIVWDLVTVAAQKAPYGNLRIQKSYSYPTNTGNIQTLDATKLSGLSNVSTETVASIVETLGGQYPGFDFGFELTDDGQNGIVRYFNVYAPSKGVLVDDVLTRGPSLVGFSVTEDGTQAITRVSEIGANGLLVRQNANNLTAGTSVMAETIVSRTDVTDLTSLQLWAQGDLFLASWPLRTYTATYVPSPGLDFGFASPGDQVNFDITMGSFHYGGTVRVSLVSVSWSGGNEQVTLNFNNIATQEAS